MTCHYGPHRADSSPSEGSLTTGDDPDDAATADTATDLPRLTEAQRREWRRWIVEAFGSADGGVIPVDYLVGLIVDREPESMDRSTVRVALTETVLPAVGREAGLEYDADRELLLKYT